MAKKLTSMVNLLSGKDRQLNLLISQAKLLTQIGIIINQVINYQIAEHTEVVKIHNGQLTLICDSAVWATRLRYMEPQIIKKLTQFSITRQISKLEIKVRPLAFTAKKSEPLKRRAHLSQNAAEQMLQEAKAINDPQLQAAIQKLARHAKDS